MPLVIPQHSGAAVQTNTQDIATLLSTQVGSTGAGKLAKFDGSNRLQSADPAGSTDLVTLSYLNTQLAAQSLGLVSYKAANRAATTGALPAYTLTGTTILTANVNGALPAQDGVTLVVNDRLLVKDETAGNAKNNFIYVVTQIGDVSTPWILTRSTDANTSAEVKAGAFTEVGPEGTVNKNTIWVMGTADPIVLGTTALTIVKMPTVTDLVAGVGLSKTGVTLNLANTSVVSGAYTLSNTAFDAQGRATNATSTTLQTYPFTATAGQTIFSTHATLLGVIKVVVNGITYNLTTNYTVNTGTGDFTLPASTLNDDVQITVLY